MPQKNIVADFEISLIKKMHVIKKTLLLKKNKN